MLTAGDRVKNKKNKENKILQPQQTTEVSEKYEDQYFVKMKDICIIILSFTLSN
jgi:hypothetical protein